MKQGGPALLFEKPKGYNVPVLINAFASMRKMEIALEVESVEEVAQRIVEFLEMRMPEGLIGKLKMLPKLAEMGAFFPKIVSKGPCQEVVRTDGFSLLDYPVLQCWPEDGGRFITLPLVFSRNPDTGKRNCGMYRMQVFDERTAGMHWQTHKQGAEHYRRMQQQGRKRMDVAVAIGADPATMYSAILPLPPDLDEMMIAGFLRQSPVEMVKCQTCDLEVPAHAEIVLEGYVELGELRTEGPFGDHTGFYSLADEYPVFHVTCVTQRKEPIYADHHRRSAAHGGLLHGQGDRAHFPAADAPATARGARYRDAGRGRVPQPDSGLDPQVLSGPRAQGDARHLGHGAGDVLQSASWWWTKTWTCRTTARWPGRRSTISIRSATSSS